MEWNGKERNLELLETLLIEHFTLATHGLGQAAIGGQSQRRRRNLALDLVIEFQSR